MLNRASKLHLLSSLFKGNLSRQQMADLKKNQAPICFTLNLGDDASPLLPDPDEPSYHIELNWSNSQPSTATSYYRYPDGRIEYVRP